MVGVRPIDGAGRPIMMDRIVPRVLEFYTDHFRGKPEEPAEYHEPVPVGWRTTQWGLHLPSGAAITITADGHEAMTRWRSIEHACEQLGVLVTAVDPQLLRLRCPGQLLMTDAGSSTISAAGRGEQVG